MSLTPDNAAWLYKLGKGKISSWVNEKIEEARGMDVESKRKLIEEKKAKAAKMLDEIREEEEDLKTYLAGLAVIKAQEREGKAKVKAVETKVEEETVVESAIRTAKLFVKDKNTEAAQRYLAPLVKSGKLTAEEANKILAGGGG